MAQGTVTILSHDPDGKEGKDIATVTFGFDGSIYEIDPSKKNRAALEKALSPYIETARKASSSPAVDQEEQSRVTPEDGEWLRSNGFPNLKDQGRLPAKATRRSGIADTAPFRGRVVPPPSPYKPRPDGAASTDVRHPPGPS